MYLEQEDYIEYDEPEMWEDMPGFEGLYRISSYGRVYSLVRNRMLKLSNTTRNYKQVNLSKDDNHHTFQFID